MGEEPFVQRITQLIRIGLRLNQLIDPGEYRFYIILNAITGTSETTVPQTGFIYLASDYPSGTDVFTLTPGRYTVEIGHQRGEVWGHAAPGGLNVLDLEIFAESVDNLFNRVSLGYTLLAMYTPKTGTIEVWNNPPSLNLVSVFDGVPPPPYTGIPPVTPTIPTVPGAELPTASEDAAWYTKVYEAMTNNVWSGLQSIATALTSIGEFFKDPWGSFTNALGGIFSKAAEESMTQSLKVTGDLRTGSTTEEVELKSNVAEIADTVESGYTDAVEKERNLDTSPSPEAAVGLLNLMSTTVLAASVANFAVNAAVESASLGQFEWMAQLEPLVVGKLGVNEIVRRSTMLPIEKSTFAQAEYFYNRKYTPFIPTYTDLINMVVKEKLTVPEFTDIMKLQGYNEYWSGKIWDAHFIAPSLGQILTSYRRGHIPLEEVQRLQILVDLDPVYDNIWKDQYYNDPSLTQARFMFETGAIDEVKVKDIIVRSGLDPLYVDNMTTFLTRFPERIFKRRHLLQVANAYRRGVFDEARLRREVDEAKFTPDVADWIVKMENVRKEINELVRRPEKYRLVTQTYAEDLFNNNDVDEIWMKQYFTDKGYDAQDVDLSMIVLNRKKATYTAKQTAS